MMDENADRSPDEPTPIWLWVLFGVQGLGWLLHGMFGAFLVLYISNVPERILPMAYALLHIGVSGLAAFVFMVGVGLPVHRRVLGRVAFVHASVASLVALPLVAVCVSVAFENSDSLMGVLQPLGIASVLIVACIGALTASRRSETVVLVCTAALAVPAVFVGAFALFVVGIGVAGVSA